VSRIAVTTCIDHLRAQKRRPELRWADLSERETEVLDAAITNENDVAPDDALAARELVQKLLDQLKPEDRLVIQYLDLEQKRSPRSAPSPAGTRRSSRCAPSAQDGSCNVLPGTYGKEHT
jgi:hypothetical protein